MRMLINSRRFLTVFAVALAFTASGAMAVQKPVSQNQQSPDIARVEAYLSGLSTLTADFSQTDANGGLAAGKFFLKRPGKMRWQYAPPTPVLIVCDGSVLTYYDSELDQISYVGIDDTLAGFLARSHIALNSESTKMTEFSSKNGVIRATVIQTKKPDEGRLTLEFSDKPLQLRQLIVTDATGNATRIQLQNMQSGVSLADSLFIFNDPRSSASRRRR